MDEVYDNAIEKLQNVERTIKSKSALKSIGQALEKLRTLKSDCVDRTPLEMNLHSLAVQIKTEPLQTMKHITDYFFQQLRVGGECFCPINGSCTRYSLNTKTGLYTFGVEFSEAAVVVTRQPKGTRKRKSAAYSFDVLHLPGLSVQDIQAHLSPLFDDMIEELNRLWIHLKVEQTPASSTASDTAILEFVE